MQRIANAYFQSDLQSNVLLSHFNDTIVLRLQVPAGHYLVLGRVTVRNFDEAQNATARLTAQDGAQVIDQTDVRLGHFEGIFHNDFLMLRLVSKSKASWSCQLRWTSSICNAPPSTGRQASAR